jgi:diguanylate cyclase (GGDEF)-like protein/PAS domain S-box-containing protein
MAAQVTDRAGPAFNARLKGAGRILVAVVIVAAFYGLGELNWRFIQPHLFLPFLPAIILALRLGGVTAGVAATILSAAVVWYAFLPPRYSFRVDSPNDVIAFALFLLAGLFMSFVYGRMSKAERAIAARKFQSLAETALPDALFIHDDQGRLVEVNHLACDSTGYSAGELLSMQMSDILGGDADDDVAADGSRRTPTLRRKDGSSLPVELRVSVFQDQGVSFHVAVVRDISRRLARDARIMRLSNLYAALSQTNQCIVRVSDRDELFHEICRIAIRYGHFQATWVGLIDEATKRVVPVHWAGEDGGLRDDLRVSTDPGSPYSTGPTGQAAVTNQMAVINDIVATGLDTSKPRRLVEAGIRSGAAFPLRVRGIMIGTVTFYSAEVGFFEADLLDLLREMALDISYALDRMEDERARHLLADGLAETNARLDGIFRGSLDPIATVDADMRFTGWNPPYQAVFETLVDHPPRKGQRVSDAVAPEQDRLARHLAGWRGALAGQQVSLDWDIPSTSGEASYSSHYGPIRDLAGRIIGAFHVGRDVTEIKRHQQQLEHIAHHDVLTNLPNRILLADRLQQAIDHSQRRGTPIAVAYLDLDGFKEVNDNYGHTIGDLLLVGLAAQMKQVLRKGDTLARIGGDEFVAILTDLDRPKDCEHLLERLQKAVSAPIVVKDLVLQVSASIGATLFPIDGSDADLLIRHADQAMYLAKQAGRNCYHLFNRDEADLLKAQSALIRQIGKGLEAAEFTLFYQPKVNMRTGEVTGAEALIRWFHPERGLVSPGAFLPEIEDHPIAA